jgi:ABC-type transporter Mla subunit MlaD
MVVRRIIGAVMLITALAILVLSVLGALYVGDAVRSLTGNIGATLQLTADGLATVRGSMLTAQGTLDDVAAAIGTSVTTTANLSTTVQETGPLLENITTVVTQEVPENIESIQDALPSMIQVADVIDNTLSRLSDFGFEREIQLPLGVTIPLAFDLGIEYDPEVPFDTSLIAFQDSLNGLPESLRALESGLADASANTQTLSDDLLATSASLETINSRVAELGPMMDQYVQLIDQLATTMDDVQSRLADQLDLIATGATGMFILLALSQLAPLYLGYELISGRREPAAPVDRAGLPAADTPAAPYPAAAVEDGDRPGADA